MSSMIHITEAEKSQARVIARLIMMAMTDECCLHFCAEGYGLESFLKMMVLLVEREDSQYSYRNTYVAVDGDKVIGIAVSYGDIQARLPASQDIVHQPVFLHPCQNGLCRYIRVPTLGMDGEVQAVANRRQGIARRLVLATKEKADKMGLPLGLLVDKGNSSGAAFYDSIGFRVSNESHWGGHEMKHLIL